MNIFGIGVDIVEVDRVARLLSEHGTRFLDRVFAVEERVYCASQHTPAISYAARFAAKEAVSKAFGTGIGAKMDFTEIVVLKEESGRPYIELRGAAAVHASEVGVSQVMISLSHTASAAVAQAIALKA